MELFFSDNVISDVIILDLQESKHCIKVLRKSVGDVVNVVDGVGNFYKGETVLISKKGCQIKINEILNDYGKKKYYIHIAISPIKNHDRLEWFIEKSVEIGIDEISFIQCERTLRKNIKLERINRIAITAMKQTLKAKLPKINQIENFNSFLDRCNEKTKFICHLENNERKNLFSFKESIINSSGSCILIGPEGDFTSKEISISKKNSFIPISLGESRLRTETAGVVSCNLINAIYEF
jgi:16S rRNA (uracil1498-N3)-methyltransferase